MVNEEILEGLRSALNRKQSLKQAMMSFYNAGYEKKEIELAARELQESQQSQPENVSTKPAQEFQKPVLKQEPKQLEPAVKTKPKVSNYEEESKENAPHPMQKVSNYGQTPQKPKAKILIFIIIFLLLLLMGILASVFLFKQEILNLFNNLF